MLPASIVLAAVIIGGAIIYLVKSGAPRVERPSGTATSSAVDASAELNLKPRDVILGDPKAPVTLIEYGDYQCPWCGKFFSEVEPQIVANYVKPGKVRMVFRDFAVLGPESTAAANAAECAKDEGKFWAYHDALYVAEIKDGHENNGNMTKDFFLKIGNDLKLSSGFQKCLDTNKYDAEVKASNESASALGVAGTPGFFINSTNIPGFESYDQMKSTIDAALAAGKAQ